MMYDTDLKWIVHPRKKILSSFTHPQVIPNLYECLCSAEHKGRYSEECGKQSSSGASLTCIVFFFPTMEVNGAPKQLGYKLSSKYLPLCSAEQRNSYRFGTTWGWVNDDRIFIFGRTIPLMMNVNPHMCSIKTVQKQIASLIGHSLWSHTVWPQKLFCNFLASLKRLSDVF